MKKRIFPLLLSLCAFLLLCSCSGNPLPDGLEEPVLLDAGRAVVTDLNENNWQAVYDRLREDAQETTTPETIQSYTLELLEEVGAYQQEKDAMATGQKLDSGEAYGTAVFYCKHEKDYVMYRIAFSTDMELIGLQMKKQ